MAYPVLIGLPSPDPMVTFKLFDVAPFTVGVVGAFASVQNVGSDAESVVPIAFVAYALNHQCVFTPRLDTARL